MNPNQSQLLADVDISIIKIRGVYAQWARENHVNYHELLVLNTLRVFGPCTQKQICEQYLVPKQTIFNIVSDLRKAGYIVSRNAPGDLREKVIELTASGLDYAQRLLEPMLRVEGLVVKKMGSKSLRLITELAHQYVEAIEEALCESEKNNKEGNQYAKE